MFVDRDHRIPTDDRALETEVETADGTGTRNEENRNEDEDESGTRSKRTHGA